MSSLPIFILILKLLSSKSTIMNYLKNRYPFKYFTNLFKIVNQNCDVLPAASLELKRNKSDSVLATSTETVKKPSAATLLDKKPSGINLSNAGSRSSIPFSKTSSEHSLKVLLNKGASPKPPSKCNLSKELQFKLNKLQASREVLSEEGRPKLKRAYPWQNFNLNSLSQTDMDKTKAKRRLSGNRLQLMKSASDQSMTTASQTSLKSSSNHSIITVGSRSLSGRSSNESLDKIKNQMPLFKSILKKSSSKTKPMKEVSFNNISTIYRPGGSYQATKKPMVQFKSIPNQSKNSPSDLKKTNCEKIIANTCLGRSEPLKEENSFLYLYSAKKQKTLR